MTRGMQRGYYSEIVGASATLNIGVRLKSVDNRVERILLLYYLSKPTYSSVASIADLVMYRHPKSPRNLVSLEVSFHGPRDY